MKKYAPFHEQLRYERECRSWSQADLAEKVGCDTKTVSRWENGETLPRSYYRQTICALFGKSAEEFGLMEKHVPSASPFSSPATDVGHEPLAESSSSPLAGPSLTTENSTDTSDAFQADRNDVLQHTEQAETPFDASPTSPPLQTLGKVALLRQTKGTILCTYHAHTSWVLAVAWEPEGERIASAGGDGVVQVWDANTARMLLIYRGHTWLSEKVNWPPKIYIIAWSPEGFYLASAGDGAKVYVWDVTTGQTIIKYEKHTGMLPNVFALAWSPDGKRIASACSIGGFDKTIHGWNPKTGRTVLRYEVSYGLLPHFSVSSIAWSPQGDRIASACGDKTIRIWDAITGKPLATFKTNSDWVYRLAWSPDGQKLALAHSNPTAEILDVLTGEVILTYHGHQQNVRNIAWSPDGSCLATASNDTTVQVWDATTGACHYIHKEHDAQTTSVTWSPDGTRIASSSNDKTVQVWQAM